jgi:hypothetical protein
MVPPSIFPFKTDEFSRHQHVALLKLRPVATQFFSIHPFWATPKGQSEKKIINKKIKIKMVLAHEGGRTTPSQMGVAKWG